MKKILACLIAVLMLATPLKAFAAASPEVEPASEETASQEIESASEEPASQEIAPVEEETASVEPLNYDYDELVVGTTMPMYGTFFTAMWGNGSSDIDVRQLIHGYNLVEWDSEESGFELDPSVVSGSLVQQNEAGDHIYNITLYSDLYWSDGSRITAWDYAFSFLLRIASEIEELGGTPEIMDYLTGYDAYMNGTVPYLSGVRVTDDINLVITISNEVLPFFYELALLDCTPCPIGEVAPDCQVRDDGNGIYIQGDFSAELLRDTLLGEDGYLLQPKITSGAYKLVSFDGKEARFELNEWYKGDKDGVKPTIQRLIFREADSDTMIDELMAGDYGLLTRTGGAEQIQAGMQAISEDQRYGVTNYPRSGMSFIAFDPDNSIFDSADLRKAIAYAIDKDAMTSDAVSNYGLRVDGYYGIGQWMYRLLSGTTAFPVEEPAADATAKEQEEYEQAIEDWEALTEQMEDLPLYEMDAEQAVNLLEKDGWTLNRQGESFDASTDDVRCKMVDDVLVPLELKLVYAESATVGDALQDLVAPLAEIGIVVTVEGVDQLLERYYGQIDRDYDMIFLASDFDVKFDPSPLFNPEGDSNYIGSDDDELYTLARSMIQTKAGDLMAYCEKWLAFQELFIELEPLIPVYSNIYFDFYPKVLQDYNVSEYTTWAQAIVPAFMSDIPDDLLEAEEEDEFID